MSEYSELSYMLMCSYSVVTFGRSLVDPQSPASAESFGLNPEQVSSLSGYTTYTLW